MAKRKQVTNNVSLSQNLLNQVDLFLDSEHAAANGYNSRPDVIIQALRDFFEKNKTIMELAQQQKIAIKKMKSDSIVLSDGAVKEEITMSVIEKDGDKILVCSHHSDPNCRHRNFCLQSPDVWTFLDKHKMKVVRQR